MAASSSSDSDSSSSGSSSPEPGNVQKQTVKATSNAKEESSDDSSSSDSGSGSDSSSDSDSESSPENSDEMDTSEDVAEKDSPSERIPVSKNFKAPAGFKPVQKQAPPSSKTSSLLSNLRGQQVVHITAPSFLPLSKVKEITMSKIAKGEPIITHESTNYGIPAESFKHKESEEKSLLVFDPKTQKYSRAGQHIPSYHIQELMELPKPDTDAIETLRNYVKPPRAHPKNMKMRFRPVGSLPAAPETLGSDSESEAEPSFKAPSGGKRKHPHTDGDATQSTTSPSRKKSKKHSSQDAGEEKAQKKSKKSDKSREEKKRKKSEKA